MDLKSTFETLKDRATDLAQAGVAQSKRLAEIAKLKAANMAEEDAIKKAYIEIGKLYYAENGAASKAAIETNNERIAELKQPGDPEVEAAAEEIETNDEPVETSESFEEPSAGEEKQD